MSGLTALFLFVLVGCAAMTAPTSGPLPACTAERVELLEPCDWRAFNSQRRSESLEGYYVSTVSAAAAADSDFVGDLIIAERGDNTLVVSIDGYSPATNHTCAGAFEGVAGDATLAPVAPSESETCRASIRRTGRSGEVFFAMRLPCHDACGARAYPGGVYRLRRRD